MINLIYLDIGKYHWNNIVSSNNHFVFSPKNDILKF